MLRKINCSVSTEEIKKAIISCDSIYLTNCIIQPTEKVPDIRLPSEFSVGLPHGKKPEINSEIQLIDCSVNAELNFEDTVFAKNVVFNGTWFHERSVFSGSRFAQTQFISVIFDDAVTFSRANFENVSYFSSARFIGDANFSECKFSEVHFNDAEFSNGAIFSDTDFEGDAYFSSAKFSGDAIFDMQRQGMHFGDAYFNGAEFIGIADFSGRKFAKIQFSYAIFNNNVIFSGAHCERVAYFSNTRFAAVADFSRCRFTEVHFNNTIFGDDIVFSGTIFGNETFFIGAKFIGEAKFSSNEDTTRLGDAHFDNAEFSKIANFSKCDFSRARFNRSIFNEDAVFSDTNFGDGAYFSNSKFVGSAYFSMRESDSLCNKAYFDSAEFNGIADFSKRKFVKARFSNAIFNDSAIFLDTKFENTAHFSSTNFSGEVRLELTVGEESPNNLYFDSAQFAKEVDFSGRNFAKVCFLGAIFGNEDKKTIFSKENFCGEANFARSIFGAEPQIIDITDVMFEADLEPDTRLRRTKSIYSLAHSLLDSNLDSQADYLFEKSGKAFEEIYQVKREKENYDCVITSYRLAERAYDSAKERSKAGELYVKAMEFKRRFPRSLPERIWLNILKHTCRYGESVKRFLFWTLIIIVLFALIYTYTPYLQKPSSTLLRSVIYLVAASVPLILALSFQTMRRLIGGLIVSIGIILLLILSFQPVEINEYSGGVLSYLGNTRFCPIVRGLYFSFTTFTTLGFGDIVASNNAAVFCTCLEVLFGYVMFGVLITLLARKIVR